MLTIPESILAAARQDGPHCPVVRQWLYEQLAIAGVISNASPADWPMPVWQAYEKLRTVAGEDPGLVSAAGLFESLHSGDV